MQANQLSHEREPIRSNSVNGSSSIPLWVGGVVLVGGFLMTLGGIIALVNPSMLTSPHGEITGAVHIYAGYFAVRNLALGLFLPLLLALRAHRVLGSLMLLAGIIQILDVVMDCIEGRWAIVPGVLILGLLYLIGAARVSGAPFWRRAFWS